MVNEIVKYDNELNSVALRNFSSNQLNTLMAICSRMREKKQDEYVFTFNQLKQYIKLDKNYTIKEFEEEIMSVNKKLLSLNFELRTETKRIQFVLFTTFETDLNKQTLTVSVNDKFSFLLNELTSNFTRFELEEFVNLKSSYSKELYRRLKQFRSTGLYKITIEEFRRLLDVPKKYRMCDVDRWVLTPINKELSKIFKNFKIKKIKKAGRGRGGVVTHIEFKFTPEEKKEKKRQISKNLTVMSTPSYIKEQIRDISKPIGPIVETEEGVKRHKELLEKLQNK